MPAVYVKKDAYMYENRPPTDICKPPLHGVAAYET